jgi:protein TonB
MYDCLTSKLVAMKSSSQNTLSKGMKPSTLFQLGLIFSLGITLVGFEYAHVDIKREKVTTAKMDAVEMETIIDYDIKKPDVPKTTQPQETHQQNMNNTTTQQQVSTNIQTTQNQQQVTTNIGIPGDTTVVIIDTWPPEKPITNEIFDIVEEMPTYTRLLTIKDKVKRKAETEKELLGNINKKIKYPEMALATGIEGKVFVEFIVDTEGEITNVKIKKGVHEDLDEEAMRAVKSLPKMVPGKQLDKPVNVRYTIPVIFKITH